LFVAIDRTSKLVVVELVERADMRAAAAFLEALVEAVPYRIHTVLTDDGIHFADLPKNRQGPAARFRGHPFDRLCLLHGIEHRLTKPNHPWTNGQVERMNKTIKDATVKRYFYDTHQQLKAHLTDFLRAYNFARRLKTLKGLTPYEYLCKLWTQTPDRFTLDPTHQMPRLKS
jgi:transposase InsO family protein